MFRHCVGSRQGGAVVSGRPNVRASRRNVGGYEAGRVVRGSTHSIDLPSSWVRGGHRRGRRPEPSSLGRGQGRGSTGRRSSWRRSAERAFAASVVPRFQIRDRQSRRARTAREDGASKSNFGRILATDFAAHNKLLISTKAGYDMWPGPYGDSDRASTCSRHSINHSPEWVSTTSTSSTPTASTPTPRSGRRSAPAVATAVTQGKAEDDRISSSPVTRPRHVVAVIRRRATESRWALPEIDLVCEPIHIISPHVVRR